ncbi:MAG: alpha/beta fold hydrolase, partial [Chloroflexi bacterium]|nr:alpha/beta fold hydrolase [Chloroflexota bacterium]
DSAGVIRNLNLGLTHVMGISMGGFISLELAIRYPELVDKLTLVATSAGGPTHVNAAPEILALLARNDSEDVETRVRRTFSQIAGPGYMDAHPADLADIVRHAQLKPMSLESYQRQIGAVISHNVSDRLSRITAPTLVVHGDADPLVPYANGQYLAAHIAGARLLTYPGVGHLPPIEATERFNRDVAEFLG